MANSGYVKLRRGILEHYQDGKVSAYEFHIYVLLILEADYKTGIWHGSAEKLSIVYRIAPSTCRDVLSKLHQKGYIRRFNLPGKHGNYPVLINKYECSDGSGSDIYLNAKKSKDWRHPIYERSGTVAGGWREGSTVQEVRTKNEEKTPRKTQRGHSPEEIRQIEAKQKRLELEAEVAREVYVGAGPRIVDVMPDLASRIRAIAKAKAMPGRANYYD